MAVAIHDGTMRAVMAETDKHEDFAVRIARVFRAPVARVFEAWSNPEDLRKWAWGTLGNNVQAEVNFRVGGDYRIETSRPNQERWTFSGKYLEIIPHQKLVYTVHWDAPMGYEPSTETVTVEFTGRDDTTEVSFSHDGLPDQACRDEHARGWTNTFDMLDGILSAKDGVQ